MRIISDFRDYYDSMLALGQDFDLQFVRQRKLIFIDTYPFPKFGKSRHRFGLGYYWGWSSNDLARSVKCDLDVQDHVIGFCGQLYGCVKLSVPDPDQPPYSSKRISAFCYDIEAVDAFLEKHFSAKQLVEYHNPIRWKQASRTGRKWPGRYVRELFVHFFEDVTTFSNGFEKKFIEHNAPVITAEDKAYRPDTKKWQAALVINPCLQDFEFFRRFDHYQAFQEIMMFVANMASPEKPIPHVSDEDLAACKGFDKWSFRQPPGKKKRKKSK